MIGNKRGTMHVDTGRNVSLVSVHLDATSKKAAACTVFSEAQDIRQGTAGTKESNQSSCRIQGAAESFIGNCSIGKHASASGT